MTHRVSRSQTKKWLDQTQCYLTGSDNVTEQWFKHTEQWCGEVWQRIDLLLCQIHLFVCGTSLPKTVVPSKCKKLFPGRIRPTFFKGIFSFLFPSYPVICHCVRIHISTGCDRDNILKKVFLFWFSNTCESVWIIIIHEVWSVLYISFFVEKNEFLFLIRGKTRGKENITD